MAVVAPSVAADALSTELTAPPDAGVTAAQIESKIKEAEAATDLDEATKDKVLEQLRRALGNLETANAHEAKAAAYADALTAAPIETVAARKQLAALQEAAPSPVPTHLSLSEIEQRLTQTQVEASVTETKVSEIDKALEGRKLRLEQARQRIVEARSRLEEISTDLQLPGAEGEPRALTQARLWAQQTAQQALWSEVRMLEQELVSAEVREDLLKAQRDLAKARLERLRAEHARLAGARNERRRAEVERAQALAIAAEAESADADPHVQALRRDNAVLAQSLAALTDKLDALSRSPAELREQDERIEAEYHAARQRIEIAGISEAFGQLLLDRRKQLPDLRLVRQQLAERQEALIDSMLRQLRYEENRRQLQDRDAFLDGETADVPAEEREAVRDQLNQAATQRLELLDQALELEETYQRLLGEVNFATTELLETAAGYDAFLAERLLWVRSAQTLDWATLTMLPSAVAWLVNPAGWLDVVAILVDLAWTSAVFWLLVVAVSILLWKGRAMRRALRSTAEPLRRVRTDSFRHTAKALALTLLDALAWPLLLAGIGWLLRESAAVTPFARSVGDAAVGLSLALYLLRAFRILCVPRGVGETHFRWDSKRVARLRKQLDWLVAALLPLGFVAIAIYSQDHNDYIASLGRLALMLLLIAFAVFIGRVLHPAEGVFAGVLTEHPTGFASRSRYLWYAAVLSVPLALAVLATLGYTYTAGTLLDAMVKQLWLVLGLVVLHQSIVRWLIVTRRQLALRAALERQAARRAEAARQAEEESSSSSLQVEEPQADLSALDEQSRKLINGVIALLGVGGLWLIWRDLLPALAVFDRVALWHYTAVTQQTETVEPFTLVDLGVVALIGFVTFAAARHLPALIEILLLKQTSVSAGSRYAIKTLAGYAILATAVLLIFSSLGLSWSQAQWLVAALGVGIGFGLQEIVANFISGLIILFERPVRVGDIVTIGETSGVVTRIQIRATTIRNWDRQELLVPNKEFITGRLLNWTLTDQTNRITIPVGVAYGSDTRKALQLLGEIAAQHEEVLDDPAPLITFESFGDNSLLLVLRCYLANLDNRLATISDIHQMINERFAEAGISIAFPQRDVHMFTSQPLDVRLHRAKVDDATPA
jgi:potassium efflux system protein